MQTRAGINTFFNHILILILVISNLYKLSLGKGGFLTEPDERNFFWSFSFLKRLSMFNFSGALESLFSAKGRPVEVLLKSIPASVQYISAKIFDSNVMETKNMWAVFSFNILIYLGILYLLYKIALLVFNQKTPALFTVVIYSFLINSYVYLRHIYPYDTSLLILLFVTYKLAKIYINKEQISPFDAFKLGAWAFLFFMFYPTFYMSFFGLYLVFVWIHKDLIKHHLSLFIKLSVSYVFGSVALLFMTELISNFAGRSYIHNLINLSGTIDQGDYDESLYFLFKYLFEVEVLTGWFLILFLIVFVVTVFSMIKTLDRRKNFLMILFFSQLVFYLIHTGVLCQWQQKMTVYIRQMHQYMPLLALFSVYGYHSLRTKFSKFIYVDYWVVVILFVFSLKDIYAYNKIAYPRDLYWKYLRNTQRDLIIEIPEYSDSWSNLPSRFLENEKITNHSDTIIAVNTAYFFPVKDINKYNSFVHPHGYNVFYQGVHFLNWKAYQFEGYTTLERSNIDKMKLKIRLLRNK